MQRHALVAILTEKFSKEADNPHQLYLPPSPFLIITHNFSIPVVINLIVHINKNRNCKCLLI